jgi:hypothetical protein
LTPEDLIEAYRAEDNLAFNANQEEALEWFRSKQREGRFTVMLQVAEKCIFIPVSSAPSERVASTAGQTYTKRRVRLDAAIAEAIVVLHESQRDLAQYIIDASPELIRHSLQEAFRIEGVWGNSANSITSSSSDEENVDEDQGDSPGSSDDD